MGVLEGEHGGGEVTAGIEFKFKFKFDLFLGSLPGIFQTRKYPEGPPASCRGEDSRRDLVGELSSSPKLAGLRLGRCPGLAPGGSGEAQE